MLPAAEAQAPSTSKAAAASSPPAVEALWKRNGCHHGYTRKVARPLIRRAILRDRSARRYVRCAMSGRSHRKLVLYARRWLRYERAVNRVTPFRGPHGTRWAIPWRVVNCESGGLWWKHNPSSPARGPYQLLGHGEPWPANTPRARMAHHRIARALYLSSGLGPWVSSRSCWG